MKQKSKNQLKNQLKRERKVKTKFAPQPQFPIKMKLRKGDAVVHRITQTEGKVLRIYPSHGLVVVKFDITKDMRKEWAKHKLPILKKRCLVNPDRLVAKIKGGKKPNESVKQVIRVGRSRMSQSNK